MELEAKADVVRSREEILRKGEGIFAESDRNGAAKSSSNLMIKKISSWIIQAMLIIELQCFSPYFLFLFLSITSKIPIGTQAITVRRARQIAERDWKRAL